MTMRYLTILVSVLAGLGFGASAVGAAAWVLDLVVADVHAVDWLIDDAWGHLVLVLAGALWLARLIWHGNLAR